MPITQSLSMGQKWAHYSKRYGTTSALLRYIGRRAPRTWTLIGPVATSGYQRYWTNGTGTKILNLGGGGNLREEWLTADIDPRADVFVDCGKALPFANSSIDAIMLEEVIEHLDFRDGRNLLQECRRVLKSDGQLRVATPDFSWFAGLQDISNLGDVEKDVSDFVYREGQRFMRVPEAPDCLMLAATINQVFLSHGHRFVYTANSLESLFGLAGFRFQRSSYQDSNSRLGRFDSHAERFGHPPEISLYYDAWTTEQSS